MSRKTITERVKRCKESKTRIDIIMTWVNDWETEQTMLCNKLPLSIDIRDFDELCIVNGQLREITNKKFTALYNILCVIGLPEQAQEGGQIYGWGKYQTGLIAIMGRYIANHKWDEIRTVTDKLLIANQANFKGVKHIITLHHKQQESRVSALSNKPIAEPVVRITEIEEIIEIYNKTDSLRETAAICGINWQKVRKILITAGKYENEITDKIAELHKMGLNNDEIAHRLNIARGSLNSYLPYEKGIYNLTDPSDNALKIRKYRKNKIDK